MLTPAENERLTRVGPGTPMGGLLRRYWYPIATAGEFDGRWTKRVRLLGEDLVLYRDRTGRFGLIAEACPHRRASLAYGIPTDDGIRCPYHGWKFDGSGACLEQPNEPAGSAFRDKVTTPAYPVAELGGMVWAYLGPAPAPLIPRLDGFFAPGAIRSVGQCVIPCNWLQIMENSLDPMHAEWLHGHYAEFLREKEGTKYPLSRRTVKIAFDEIPVGIAKRRLLEGQTEDCDDWTIGHPVIFPNILAIGSANPTWMQYSFQIRVPVDDTHTLHYWYDAFVPPSDSHPHPRLFGGVNLYDVPYLDARGEYLVDYIYGQDIMVWLKQGPIADRSRESIGASDRGITLYRRMLAREIDRVAAGADPKCVVRDPAADAIVEVPIERHMNARSDGFGRFQRRHVLSHSPIFGDLLALFDRAPEPVAAGHS